MKSGLLIAAILASFVSANAGWALDGTVFPGKGDKQVWLSACRIGNDATALAKAKKSDAAVAKFQQAIAMYPYSDGLYRNLGLTCEQRAQSGDMKKAEAAYRKACDLDAKDWTNWSNLASALAKQEKYRESRDAGVKALNCKPAEKAVSIKASVDDINRYLAQQK